MKNAPLRNASLQVSFENKHLRVSQTFKFPSCSVGFCYTFVWSQTTATAFNLCSALVVSHPVLFVPYCFLILCSLLLFISSRFIQLVINGSIHAEFVVNKTIHFCTSATRQSRCLHICLPQLHFNHILSLPKLLNLFFPLLIFPSVN